MAHKWIRKLIEDTALSLGDDIQYAYGRTSDFNIIRDKRYPFINTDLLTASAEYSVDNVSNYTKTWRADMAFYQIDKEASSPEDYAEILDFTDGLVDSFINKLNLRDDGVVITNISQDPFIKATSDVLTGHFLSFNIQVPDNYDYCGDC